MFRVLALLAVLAASAAAAEEYTYWIDDCTAEAARATGCEAGDTELGRWALEMWQRESGGAITFRKSATEEHARLRIHWANGAMNLYGETTPVMVDGQRGAVIYVLPDTRELGRDIDAATRNDRLLRETIVYLTCVHEAGHALGLQHTRDFADIMYSFQYGGNFVEYFMRYRRQLQGRGEIPKYSGISDGDRQAIKRTVNQR